MVIVRDAESIIKRVENAKVTKFLYLFICCEQYKELLLRKKCALITFILFGTTIHNVRGVADVHVEIHFCLHLSTFSFSKIFFLFFFL